MLAKSDHSDFTLGDALRNTLMGGALGGVLHAGGGAVGDAWRAARGTPGGAAAMAPDAPRPLGDAPTMRPGESTSVHPDAPVVRPGGETPDIRPGGDTPTPRPTEPGTSPVHGETPPVASDSAPNGKAPIVEPGNTASPHQAPANATSSPASAPPSSAVSTPNPNGGSAVATAPMATSGKSQPTNVPPGTATSGSGAIPATGAQASGMHPQPVSASTSGSISPTPGIGHNSGTIPTTGAIQPSLPPGPVRGTQRKLGPREPFKFRDPAEDTQIVRDARYGIDALIRDGKILSNDTGAAYKEILLQTEHGGPSTVAIRIYGRIDANKNGIKGFTPRNEDFDSSNLAQHIEQAIPDEVLGLHWVLINATTRREITEFDVVTRYGLIEHKPAWNKKILAQHYNQQKHTNLPAIVFSEKIFNSDKKVSIIRAQGGDVVGNLNDLLKLLR